MVETLELDIEELREAGSSGGDFMGYYARGHFDPEFFAERCNTYGPHIDSHDRRFVRPKHVRHEYWRTVMVEDDPGEFQFNKSEKGPGAWAVTVADPIMQERYEIMELRNQVSMLKNKRLEWEGDITWLLRHANPSDQDWVDKARDLLDTLTPKAQRLDLP